MTTLRERGDPAEAQRFGPAELDHALADVMRSTSASVGLLYLLEPGGRALRLALLSGASAQLAAPWARVRVEAPFPVGTAIRERRLVWLGSQEEMARRYPRLGIVLPYDFMLAAAPITGEAQAWGAIVLLWPVWHSPQLSASELEAIDACCRRTGRLVEQAAAQGRSLLPVGQPRVLAPDRSAAPDPVQALAALDFAARLPVGCCALDLEGKLTFINPAGAELLGVGAAALLGHRPWQVLLWLHDPVFEDRYRSAVLSRQPTSFTALRPPDQWLLFELFPDHSGVSVHITPAGNGPAAAPPGTRQPLPSEPMGATGLYHLTHLAAALTEAVGVGDVVELVTEQLVPGFGPDAMALMTVDEGRLRIVGYRGYGRELMDRFDGEPLTSATPAAAVLVSGAPAFFTGFGELQHAYPAAMHQDGMASWAFLPLTTAGRALGSVVLAYARPRAFPGAERALLTSLAGLIAQALDRARLYDTKHQLAQALQTGLLPQTLPRIPGLEVAARYLPAGQAVDIGGDFYDLIRCDEGLAVAAIGDVQGHNTHAAALMGQVRTAVHAHATTGSTPGDVLARTNRLLTDLDPDLFTSCLIAQIDLPRARALLATAGHPPPLLRHPDGRTEVLRLTPGLLLGVATDADYPTTEIALPPGAVLALFTDGLVESPGADIDDAVAGLAARLARADEPTLDALADSLLQHRATPHTDDIALLVLRVGPSGPGVPGR